MVRVGASSLTMGQKQSVDTDAGRKVWQQKLMEILFYCFYFLSEIGSKRM